MSVHLLGLAPLPRLGTPRSVTGNTNPISLIRLFGLVKLSLLGDQSQIKPVSSSDTPSDGPLSVEGRREEVDGNCLVRESLIRSTQRTTQSFIPSELVLDCARDNIVMQSDVGPLETSQLSNVMARCKIAEFGTCFFNERAIWNQGLQWTRTLSRELIS